MRKYYCDACGIECKQIKVLEVPCHLYSFKDKAGYSDVEGNRVSGRMDGIDLCQKCYNKAHEGALKSINL